MKSIKYYVGDYFDFIANMNFRRTNTWLMARVGFYMGLIYFTLI